MDYDESAAESKRKELRDAALSAGALVRELPGTTLDSVLEAFTCVTPPQRPKLVFELITVHSLHTTPKARSRKAGNILLNWRKLVDIVPDISLAGIGASTLPVAPVLAAVLAGLYVWNKVLRGSVEDFSDAEAITILALWQHRDGDNKIEENDGMEKTNQLLAQYSMPPLTPGQYAAVVNRLVQIDCVELENGVIELREEVLVSYI